MVLDNAGSGCKYEQSLELNVLDIRDESTCNVISHRSYYLFGVKTFMLHIMRDLKDNSLYVQYIP